MVIAPMKFQPIFKERMWGGAHLAEIFAKPLPAGRPIGESWELTDLPDDCSVVAQGPAAGMTLRQLLTDHGPALGFAPSQCAPPFGLLIKLLDAQERLSVQVHPGPAAAHKYPGAAPKSECWYVISAEPDAVIYRGLKPGVTADQVRSAATAGSLDQLITTYPARPGDFHFLPAGTIHALGAGIVVAEIQTPSDTTYRLYDWDRRDAQGRSRPLHLDQALESIDFNLDRQSAAPRSASFAESAAALFTVANTLGTAQLLLDGPDFVVIHVSQPQVGRQSVKSAHPFVMISLSAGGAIAASDAAAGFCPFEPGDTILVPALDRLSLDCTKPGDYLFTSLPISQE